MTTQTMGRAAAPWGWLAGWVGANVLGWGTGLLMIVAVGWGLQERLERSIGAVGAGLVAFTLAGLAAGALIGALQGAALRGFGVPLPAWAGVTTGALGVGIGLLMTSAIVLDPGERFDPGVVALVLIPGLLLALAQWRVLRLALPRAGWWVAAGTIGFVIAFLGAMASGGEGRELIAAALCGLAYAAITGPALVWLRAQSV